MLLFALLLVEFDVLPVSYDVLPTEYAVLDTPATLPVDRSHDATTDLPGRQGTDARLLHARKLAYRRARETAEREGKAVYRSDGKPGDALPKGLYELIRDKDGEVWYREVEPAGVPIPKPDRTATRMATEECLT